MFLFKCCSNHSLPSFLKSTKSRPTKNSTLISNQSLHLRCSNEVVKNLSVEVLDVSTDSDFPEIILNKGISLADESALKHNSFCTSELGKRTGDDGKRGKCQFGIHATSSNSVVVLVGENAVKTKLSKHRSSVPNVCFWDSVSENTKRKVEESSVNSTKCLQNKAFLETYACTEPQLNDDLFMPQSSDSISIDRFEFVFVRTSKRVRIQIDDFYFQNTTSATAHQEMVKTPFRSSVSKVDYEDLKRESCDSDTHSLDFNTHSNLPKQLQLNVSIKEPSLAVDGTSCRELLESTLLSNSPIDPFVSNDDLIIEGTFSSDRQKLELDGSNIVEVAEESSISWASPGNQNVDQVKATPIHEPYGMPVFSTSILSEVPWKTICQTSNDEQTFGKFSGTTDDNVTIITECGTLRSDNPERTIPDLIVHPVTETPSDSSVGLIFAGDSASFLEEFLPRESYSPSVRFTLVDNSLTPSTSDDSLKNPEEEVTSSNDSLLSRKSPTEPFLRPCDFGESRITFARSPEDQKSFPSDFQSSQTCSGNTSVVDSLLQSPESPSEGIDFRHFYSRSLPNLNKQPYNSMSSFGIIEEYFNRYIVESGSSEDEGLGSQVDPKSEAVPHDSESTGECHEDMCRQHSLEKLTEICKKFSSSYLNFLQSSRSECGLDSALLHDCNSYSKDDIIFNQFTEGNTDQTAQNDSTAALSALYAAIFPHADSKTAAESVVPTELRPARKSSMVGRSVSLREASESSPGCETNKVSTAKKKKVPTATLR